MTVLTRWSPYRELNALQSRMNRLFEAQYGGREESLTSLRLTLGQAARTRCFQSASVRAPVKLSLASRRY